MIYVSLLMYNNSNISLTIKHVRFIYNFLKDIQIEQSAVLCARLTNIKYIF